MTLAAKHMDPVVGIDMHMVQPPPPAPPVMLPVPFVGYLIDPADYAGGCTIHVNGLPRARAGTPGMGCPPHVPPGGMFVKPPTNECEMYQGSSTVVFDGDAASAMGHQVLGCHDVGMVAPVRGWKQAVAKSLMMGSCAVVPVGGAMTLIGGAPTITTSSSPGDDPSAVAEPILETIIIQVYDAFGNPYANREFKLHIPNGDIECGTLDMIGESTINNVPRGHALLLLPDAEAPPTPGTNQNDVSSPGQVSTTDPHAQPTAQKTQSDTQEEDMVYDEHLPTPLIPDDLEFTPEDPVTTAGNHHVGAQETLQTIGIMHGIPNWKTILDHSANDQIRSTRNNALLLLQGDTIHIEPPENPSIEYRPRGIVIVTNFRTLVYLSPLARLRLRVSTDNHGHWCNARYEIRYHTIVRSGILDGLELQIDIPTTVRRAELRIFAENSTSVTDLHVGALDPPQTLSGLAQRLEGLGYLAEHNGQPNVAALARSTQMFQHDNGLSGNGAIDSLTIAAIIKGFGC